MNVDRANLVPLAIFVCGVGYTLWPNSESSAGPAAATEPAVTLKETWFNPKLEQPAERDPFAARAEASPAPVKTADRKAKPVPADAPLAVVPGASLGLKLTSVIVGARPAAVIDGRVYSLGDDVRSNEKAAERWRVVRIEADRVDLSDFRNRRATTLKFVEPTTAPAKPGTSAGAVASASPAPADDVDKLREVLGPSAAAAASPIPPEIARLLGGVIGADPKTGNLGALEAILGDVGGVRSASPTASGPSQGGTKP